MKSYIVKQNDELKIMQVLPSDEAAFLEQYKDCIMAEGNTIQELLTKFSKLMKEQSGQ